MNAEMRHTRSQALVFNHQIQYLLKEICIPLFSYLNLKRFAYAIFPLDVEQRCNGAQIWITDVDSFKAALYEFETNGASFMQAMLETPLNQMNSFLWSQDGTCEMLNLYREKFDLVKGLTIYKRHSTYIEGWCFAGGAEAYIPLTINPFTLEPFEKFIHYFSKGGYDLLRKDPPLIGFESPLNLEYKVNPNYKLFQSLDYAISPEPLCPYGVAKAGLRYKSGIIKPFVNYTIH